MALSSDSRGPVGLAEHPDWTRAAIDDLPDGVCLLRPVLDDQKNIVDFRYLYINDAGARLNRISRSDHLSHTVLQLFPQLSGTDRFRELVEVVRTGQPMRAHALPYRDLRPGARRGTRVLDIDAAPEFGDLRLIWRDVTATVEALDRLNRSSTIVDSSPNPILTTTVGAIITSCNPAAERIYGYSARELTGRSISILEDPAHIGEEAALIRRVAGGEEIDQLETVRVAKNGHRIDIVATFIPIRDAEGVIVAVASASVDITELRKANEALARSQASLVEAQRIAHIGSWELDIVNDRLEWSAECYRIFEVDASRFAASYQSFLAAIHPEDRAFVNRSYAESVADHTPYDIVHRLLTKEGRVKYVNERCETFYGPDGQPVRSVGTVYDITDRHMAEEKLRQAQAYNRGLIEASLDGLVTVDPELVITDVNRSLCRMFGRRADELIGSRFPDLFTDSHRAAEGVRLTLDRGELSDYDLTLRSAPGAREMRVSLNAATYTDPATGAVRGIFAAARDITGRTIGPLAGPAT